MPTSLRLDRLPIPRVVAEFGLCIVLGSLAFLMIIGGRALRPSNIGWLPAGDSQAHFLGWHFFRSTPWHLPLGANPPYGLEFSSSIFYSDSLPLLALPLKLFSNNLPDVFQYFGLWLLACFILQAWFAWRLLSLVGIGLMARTLATLLFLFSPPMLWRLHGHFALFSHWLVLGALYLCVLQRSGARQVIAWCALVSVAAAVHSYLWLMVMALWGADYVRRVLAAPELRAAISEPPAVAGLSLVVLWQLGFFLVSGKDWAGEGFGHYRMNLLSPFDSDNWSYLLKDIPSGRGDYEGFNFLGLGGVSALIVATPLVVNMQGWREFPKALAPLVAVVTMLSLAALSNKVGLGSLEFQYQLPDRMVPVAEIFRSSGRLFWPAYYLLLLALIWSIWRFLREGVATLVLAALLVMQVADTSAVWLGFRERFHMTSSSWKSPLTSAFWTEASRCYERLRMLPPGNVRHGWEVFAAYAAFNRLATDSVYLARVDMGRVLDAQASARRALETGQFDRNALYILDDNLEVQARSSINLKEDLLERIDGFLVLAPGWWAAEIESASEQGSTHRLCPHTQMHSK